MTVRKGGKHIGHTVIKEGILWRGKRNVCTSPSKHKYKQVHKRKRENETHLHEPQAKPNLFTVLFHGADNVDQRSGSGKRIVLLRPAGWRKEVGPGVGCFGLPGRDCSMNWHCLKTRPFD